jgi:hypothetical protein
VLTWLLQANSTGSPDAAQASAFWSGLVGAIVGGLFTLTGALLATRHASKLERSRQEFAAKAELRNNRVAVWSRLRGLQYSITSFAWLRVNAQILQKYHDAAMVRGIELHREEVRYWKHDSNRMMEVLARENKELEEVLGRIRILFEPSDALSAAIKDLSEFKIPSYSGPSPPEDHTKLESWRDATVTQAKQITTTGYEEAFERLLKLLESQIHDGPTL